MVKSLPKADRKIRVYAGMPETKAIADALKLGLVGVPKSGPMLLTKAAIEKLPKNAVVIVPVLPAHLSLAAILSSKTQTSAVLDTWKKQTKDLVTLCKGLRKRITLVDAAAIAGGDLSGLSEFKNEMVSNDLPNVARDWDFPNHQGVAALLIATDADALKIADSLDAMIDGNVAVNRPTGAVVKVLEVDEQTTNQITKERDSLREALQALTADRENRNVSDEIKLLRESTKQALDELGRAEVRGDRFSRRLSKKQDQIADYQILKVLNESLEKQVAQKDARFREREAILASHLLADVGQGPRTTDSDRVEELQQQIDALMGSTSWKLTAPIRFIRRGLAKKANS